MRLAEWIEGLRKIDINDLDTNNLGSWPPAIKTLAGALLMVLVLALGYSFSISDLESQLNSSVRKSRRSKSSLPPRRTWRRIWSYTSSR